MTTTTITGGLVNTLTPPSWVNFDVLVPPELRERVTVLTQRIDTYGPSRGDAAAVEELYNELGDSMSGRDLPDFLIGDIVRWSGYEALEDACRREGIVLPDE
jgi:hypothetical protein